jgi:autotransporter family porin
MVIDGRDILTSTGAEIGRAGTGSVTLTNGATWELNNSFI